MKQSIAISMLAAAIASLSIASAKRIVGGDQSDPTDFPYFVEMGGCGGALVAPDAVLFAAHCGDWSQRQISVGAYQTMRLTNNAVERYCVEWVPDPTYGTGGSGLNNDFALCKLDQPVEIDTSKVRLELNDNNSVPSVGEEVTVMGLGATGEGGGGPVFLRDVSVPTISNQQCSNMYGGGVTSNMLCAGLPGVGGKDSCQGDSGGPLVRRQKQSDGTFVDTHVGVVSWGEGCARPDKPGVYARTSKRRGWIEATICDRFESTADFCNNRKDNIFSKKSVASTKNANGIQTKSTCAQEAIVEVVTDKWGMETSWTLVDEDQTLVSRKGYLFQYFKNTHTLCLKSNECYTWTLFDSYQDGMNFVDAGGTGGTYNIKVNGETVVAGRGNFKDSRTAEFCTKAGNDDDNNNPVPAPTPEPTANPTLPPTLEPTKAPTSSNNDDNDNVGEACGGNTARQFKVELRTDNFGHETSWTLYRDNSQKNNGLEDLEKMIVRDNYADNQEYSEPTPDSYFCLEEDACYLFEMRDSYGDGMDEGPTKGWYQGILNGEVVFSGGNDFGNEETHYFCVSKTNDEDDNNNDNDPTMAPSSISSTTTTDPCVDDPELTFRNKAKKNCDWVTRGNKKQVRKKCKKTWKKQKLFDWCPETCGARVGLGKCEYLFDQR